MQKKILMNKEIPLDVQEYFQIVASTGGIMGLKMYQRCKEIIENNPTWFPWEHKYKSIPQEVHDAYLDEKNPRRHEPIVCSNGILNDVMSGTEVGNYSTKESLTEMLDSFIRIQKKQKQEREEKEKKDKLLWDKHYKKYNLEWRSGSCW